MWKSRADTDYVTVAKAAISRGAATRFEIAISQGVRKRQGQSRSQHFLDAFQNLKQDSYLPVEGIVHPAVWSAAQNELGRPKDKGSEKATDGDGEPPPKKPRVNSKGKDKKS